MKIYTDIEGFRAVSKPIVTIGTFDGVHLGHQKIIQRIKQLAESEGGESVVLSFYPHPRMVLYPDDQQLRLLNTQEEKIKLLSSFGVEHLILYPFSKRFSRLTAVEYVRDLLVNQIGVKQLVIGYDHHFGKNREGSLEQLIEFGGIYAFQVEEIPAQDVDAIKVSSTKIRRALEAGEIEKANKLLGYSYMLSGKVVKGDQLGRKIGFPTANIGAVDAFKLLPMDGSYVVKVKWKEQDLLGMLNIGVRPTLGGEDKKIEVHLLNFDQDIYGEELTVHFVKRLREEKKFENLEALKEQLELDKKETIRILEEA